MVSVNHLTFEFSMKFNFPTYSLASQESSTLVKGIVPLWYDGIQLRPVGLPILAAFVVALLDKRLAGSEDRLDLTHPAHLKNHRLGTLVLILGLVLERDPSYRWLSPFIHSILDSTILCHSTGTRYILITGTQIFIWFTDMKLCILSKLFGLTNGI